jgi:hypothetical protein
MGEKAPETIGEFGLRKINVDFELTQVLVN